MWDLEIVFFRFILDEQTIYRLLTSYRQNDTFTMNCVTPIDYMIYL